MKPKIIILFVLVTFGQLLFWTCDKSAMELATSSKDLSIHKFGFILGEGQWLTPGTQIQIYSQANKSRGITYEWEIDEQRLSETGNIVEWQIPEETGEHIISVTAYDIETGEKASKDTKVNVFGENAHAEPYSYSYEVEERVYKNDKYSGAKEKYSTILYMNAGNISHVKVIDGLGEHEYFANEGDFYTIGNNGTKTLLFSEPHEETPKALNDGLSSLDYLINSFDSYELLENDYKFYREDGVIVEELVFNRKIGDITFFRLSDEETEEEIILEMSYQFVEGYIFPEKVKTTSSWVFNNVEYIEVIEEIYSEIEVNAFDEEDLLEYVL
jgi:hypothetical protein